MTAPQLPRPSLLDQLAQQGAQQVPRVVTIANPAAAADWTIPVPPGVVWWVESLVATLTNSATVANRAPILQLSDGSTVVMKMSPGVQSAASNIAICNWLREFGSNQSFGVGNGFSTPFPPIPLLGGWAISVATANLQAGDQWSAIALYVIESRPPLPGQVTGLDQPERS